MKNFSQEVHISAISLYARGLSSVDVSQKLQEDLGVRVSGPTILKWCREAGINRSCKEAWAVSEKHWNAIEKLNKSPEHREQIGKLGKLYSGEKSGRWKGDNVGYYQQHRRAKKDYPYLLSQICELCGERQVEDRMRMDHTYFPYHKDLIILACSKCNILHDQNRISITFRNPRDGLYYCMVRSFVKAIQI